MIYFMGLMAGILCAFGGALKDSPYEGFYIRRFFRSVIVGGVIGLIVARMTDSCLVAFCISGYCERVVVEAYKIVRAQKPGKFMLPDPRELGRRLSFRKAL